jgi:eukaryotic-like serine/threonine-protein kinase
MDRVIRAIGDGTAVVDNGPLGRVPYIIFELAEGDARSHLAALSSVDVAWKLRSLHDTATGLRQLHTAGIAHQDLKPSNILVIGGASKLADLGRASHASISGPSDEVVFAGDNAYAPPELMYGHVDPGFAARRFGADFYLLGA